MKKGIKLTLAAVAYLSVCFAIGQYRNSLKEDVAQKTTEETTNNVAENETSADDCLANVTFEGVSQTSDTPWNTTAGVFDMEGEGECILLTPNTAALFSNIGDLAQLSFSYEIHPWVKESSDGAGLLIWILDENDTILDEESISINSEDEWQEYSLKLDSYENASKIKIICNNGANNDDACDWVVINSNK